MQNAYASNQFTQLTARFSFAPGAGVAATYRTDYAYYRGAVTTAMASTTRR